MNAEQWNRLKAWGSSTMVKIRLDTKAKQIQKFDRLQTKQHLAPELDQDNRSLAPKEMEALALGLNFPVTLKQIPNFESLQQLRLQPANLTMKQHNYSDTG